MKLMAGLLLTLILIVGSSQDPPNKVKVDTVTISERKADTLYLEQSMAVDILDSIIIEKRKK